MQTEVETHDTQESFSMILIITLKTADSASAKIAPSAAYYSLEASREGATKMLIVYFTL